MRKYVAMKVVVTGANGQLGKCLQDVAKQFPTLECIFLGREHCDIQQFGMVSQVLHSLQPDWVINAAAYTAVDKAEQEAAAARLINGEAVGHLAKVCKDVGAKLLHVSTDYVFDGTATTPYVETDAVNPIGIYGESKLMGEQLALEVYAAGTAIIRTSWVYSKHGANFVKTMLRLMKEREAIGVVKDQLGSPTYAVDLANALLTICEHPQFVPGIFHYSNSGIISWYNFAVAIQEISGLNCTVNPITTANFPTPAKRPAWSVMDCSKIERTYSIPLMEWQTSLQHCLRQLL